jgi:hypothetical protein
MNTAGRPGDQTCAWQGALTIEGDRARPQVDVTSTQQAVSSKRDDYFQVS